MVTGSLIKSLTIGLMLLGARVAAADTHADVKLYFVNLEDGATVTSPVRVVFGLRGMGVAPAGVDVPNTGHHHLLIDTTLEGAALEKPIPATQQHLHFGGGQTETELELAPGEHRLQLLLGNFSHVPHDPPVMSDPITIHVVAE